MNFWGIEIRVKISYIVLPVREQNRLDFWQENTKLESPTIWGHIFATKSHTFLFHSHHQRKCKLFFYIFLNAWANFFFSANKKIIFLWMLKTERESISFYGKRMVPKSSTFQVRVLLLKVWSISLSNGENYRRSFDDNFHSLDICSILLINRGINICSTYSAIYLPVLLLKRYRLPPCGWLVW